jgi:hypothetical protein
MSNIVFAHNFKYYGVYKATELSSYTWFIDLVYSDRILNNTAVHFIRSIV